MENDSEVPSRTRLGVCAAFLAVSAVTSFGGLPQPTATVGEPAVVCKESYIGWPSLACLRDGTLLAAFSGNRIEHVCPSGVVQVVRSADGGRTWTKPVTVGDTPVDDRDASVTELPDGEVLVSWFTSIAYYGNTHWPRYGGTVDTRPRASLLQHLGRWCVRSRDGGKTWTKPERMTLRGSTPHGPCVLKDGSLLYVGHWLDKPHGEGVNDTSARTYISCERSTDGGRTWELLCEKLPVADGATDFCEPHVTELPDGRLLALVRYGGGDCCLRQSESTDGGRTWTPMRKTELKCGGSPAHLLTLPDGRIVATYAIRAVWDGEHGYPGIGEFVSVSSDGGRTWSAADGICLRRTPAGIPQANMGYPATARLPSGGFYTVFYEPEKRGENPCLMGVKWSIGPAAVAEVKPYGGAPTLWIDGKPSTGCMFWAGKWDNDKDIEVMRKAGVHVYSPHGDQVFAGPGWFAVAAKMPGKHRLAVGGSTAIGERLFGHRWPTVWP